MKTMLRILLVLCFAQWGRSELCAQTTVSGTISTNTVWTKASSPYRINGTVRIATNARLDLESGTEVEFENGAKLSVAGQLIATGNREDSIHFKPVDSSALYSIDLEPDCDLEWRFVEMRGSEGIFQTAGAVPMMDVQISRSLFIDNVNAIVIQPAFPALIDSCAFFANETAVNFSRVNVRNSTFSQNEIGVLSGSFNLSNCTFGKHGLAAVRGGRGTIADCDFFYNPIAILEFGAINTDSILRSTFALNDTAFVATNPATIVRNNNICSNTIAVRHAFTQGADFSGNCWCTNSVTQIDATVIDGDEDPALGQVQISPVNNCPYDQVVWPGDADNSGKVDMRDVLQIGLAHGSAGPQRPSLSQVWAPQVGNLWGSTIAGTDRAFADCNGNGVIDDNDLAAIARNFGEDQVPKTSAITANEIPLCLVYPDSANPGDTIFVAVYLGDSLLPVNNGYGFALSFGYDKSIINGPVSSGQTDSSFLGTPNELLQLTVGTVSDIHWAVSRDDQNPITGFGLVGGVIIVMIDDLAKKEPVELTTRFAVLIDEEGNEIPVSLDVCPTAGSSKQGIVLAPNPATQYVEVGWDASEVAERAEMYGPAGNLVWATDTPGIGLRIDTGRFTPGVYTIALRLERGLLTKKVLILK